MPRNSKIIVKHGGKLIIRNSLIRGFYSCQNSKWDGIEVESGTNGTNYVENSKGNSLLEISKSTISFAKCGIRSGKNSDILNFNDHGGLISLFKTEFRGCDTSIIFYNDANKSNFLNIDSCFFNGQEPGNNDPKQANDHHILIYSAVNLNAHIDTLTAPIDPIFSIKITRSRFENCFNSYIHSYEKCNFGEVPTYQVECLIIKGIEISESYFLMNKKENFIHLSNINNLQIRKSYFTFACETSTPLYIKNWKKNEQDIFILDSNIMENAKWNPNEVILMLGLKTILIRGNLFNCNITNPLFSDFNYMSIKYCDFVLSESNKYILQPNVNGIVDNSYLGPYVWPPAPINSMFTSRLDTFLNGKTALTIGYLYAVGIYNNQIKNFQNGLISRNINHCFINGNLFSNNIYSINAYDNNLTNEFLIEQNLFDSSFRRSIHAVNLSNLEIFNNTFNVKSRIPISGDTDLNIMSIQSEACKAVDIRDNTFNKNNYISSTQCNGTEYWSHAYKIENSMGSPHFFVRNNISDNWHYGVFSEGANTNFTMRCNAFSISKPSCNASIWLHKGLIRDQGKPTKSSRPCDDHRIPAANVFQFDSNLVNSLSYCWDHKYGLQGKMLYFDTLGANLTPADTFEYWTQSIDQNNIEYPRLHCKTDRQLIYKECIQGQQGFQIQNTTCDQDNLYQFKKTTTNNNQTWISVHGCDEDSLLKNKRIQLWDELDAMNTWTIDSTTDIHLLSYMKSHYLNLEEANAASIAYYTPCDSITRVKEILSATPLINARIGLVDILFNEGELIQAMEIADQLHLHPLEDKIFPSASSSRNLEIGALQSVYQIAYHYWSEPDSTRTLSSGNIASLETIRSLHNAASAKAEALLSIALDTFYYHPFYYTPPIIAEDSDTSGSQGGASNNIHQINVSPNPFQDQFNLDFIVNKTFNNGSIEVYSLLNPQSPVYTGSFDNSNVNTSNSSNNENSYSGSVTIQNYSLSGLYFLVVKLDNIIYRMKILIRE
ncbi:MAG: hypothetical protein KA797_02970 [Chitinophagales bacterium]|nr:hypothetical protein [Chitinophagales bacterium]